MDIICDRFDVCRSKLLDRGQETESVARAKGWHIWRGTTMGGKEQEVILCDKCVEGGRRMLKRVEALPGQYPIPQLEIVRMTDDH
jgi:hypothetical protein